MFKAVRKCAIRSYAKKLGPKLRERYGREKKYTPAQVKRTIEEGGYSIDYLCYALAMYCDYPAFTDYHHTTGESCDYGAMRAEIADRFFHGDASFDASDVIDGGSGWSHDADHTSSHDSGGAHGHDHAPSHDAGAECGGDFGGGGDGGGGGE
jgi:hypothetical protein